ncbi:MAG: hypothetical protein REI12_11260 [Pedobacter sp.]|nr:hypothetical protein [Pedobacter sp.]
MPLLRIVSLLLFLLASPVALAAAKIAPWMMADWENPAPHLADAGINPKDVADSIGPRLMLFSHAPRDISIPGTKGARRFSGARFVSAVAKVDLPAATLRRRLQDFASYKSLFPMLTQSEVMALDARKVVARYRVEIPLPALATVTVDFRIRHNIETDGSVSALLLDGRAESLIAMLGGMTDELADQPVLSRWEALPIDARRSVLVFTYWDRIELKSFFARKLMEAYPELRVVGPYMVAAGAAEAVHRNFVSPQQVNQDIVPPGVTSLAGARYFMNELSRNGAVVFLEPEMVLAPTLKTTPLRYSSVATRLRTSPAAARKQATQYAQLPTVIKEIKSVDVQDRGQQVDLGLDVSAGLMMLRFSLDLDVRNTWVSPDRLEFRRTRGNLAQLRGASEWHALGDDTLMLTSAAHELGEDAPLLLRLAHRIVDSVPYGDTLGGMAAQLVIMERMRPWIEAHANVSEAP